MKLGNGAVFALYLVTQIAQAQPPSPRFDVVAIHHLAPDHGPLFVDSSFSPVSLGQYSDPVASLRSLISFAYNIKTPGLNLTALPKWTTTTLFSVAAKADQSDPEGNYERVRLMVRQMLIDRFGLQI